MVLMCSYASDVPLGYPGKTKTNNKTAMLITMPIYCTPISLFRKIRFYNKQTNKQMLVFCT